MSWNNHATDLFGWNASKARHLRVRLEEEGREQTLAIFDFLAASPGKTFDVDEVLDATGIPSVRSFGAYMKHSTRIGAEMGIDPNQGHSWFIDWTPPKGNAPWRYWMTRERAVWWENESPRTRLV